MNYDFGVCLWTVEIHNKMKTVTFHLIDGWSPSSVSYINDLKCFIYQFFLTHQQLKRHGCISSTVATDALVLKHQAISTHSAGWMFSALDLLHVYMLQLFWTTLRNGIIFWKKILVVQGLNCHRNCHRYPLGYFWDTESQISRNLRVISFINDAPITSLIATNPSEN